MSWSLLSILFPLVFFFCSEQGSRPGDACRAARVATERAGGGDAYCEATGACYGHVTRVQMGDIDQSSSCTGYGDYTSQSTLVTRALEHDLVVTEAAPFGDITCSVWVDWNQDGVFDDEGDEACGDAPSYGPYWFPIHVPPTALPGSTRMRIRVDWYTSDPDPCGLSYYGEVEDYTLVVSSEVPIGACCDPYTASCTDGAPALDCGAPLVFHYQQGCEELDPPCGNPGACCLDGASTCTYEYDLHCAGRFHAGLPAGVTIGEPCAVDPFLAWCGAARFDGVLLAPAGCDSVDFRAELSALLGGAPVDYVDAHRGTPTLEQLLQYRCVVTWSYWEYQNPWVFGNRLADYVDQGGKVILGYRTHLRLEGRIINEPGYCPVTVSGESVYDCYTGGGVQCPHQVFPVSWYCAPGGDNATVIPGNAWDGRMDGHTPAVAWRPDSRVAYVPAHRAGSTGSYGDWAPLTANLYVCPRLATVACCDVYTGTCTDDVPVTDCAPPARWHQDVACETLQPACGNPGACCTDDGASCTYEYDLNCIDRFVPGVPAGGTIGGPCLTDPFTPPCGQWQPAGLLYAPTAPDHPAFRDAVAELLGENVDYVDARLATPTVEQMMAYRAVLTWVKDPYADRVLMGDRLADYVDMGGRAILGEDCYADTQDNSLGGRVMSPDYFPVRFMVSPADGCSYAGDGADCIHTMHPVSSYVNNGAAIFELRPGVGSDGSCGMHPAQAWRADRRVYCSAGNQGLMYGSTGDWVALTANMVACEAAPECLAAADTDCSGVVNVFDIDPFVVALTDSTTWQATYTCDYWCANDVNGDGAVDAFDIDAFVQRLTGG